MRYRKLATAATVVAAMLLLGACNGDESGSGTSNTKDNGNSAAKVVPDIWSFEGSKRDVVKDGDSRENLLNPCRYLYSEEMNDFATEGTPWLLSNDHDASEGSPVRLCVSNEDGDVRWGTTFVGTTRVDNLGADKLYGQFRAALKGDASDFNEPLPSGIDRAFWITKGGQTTGVAYSAGEVTVSLNFTKPQPKELFLDQMKRAAPSMQLVYNAAYVAGTPTG